LLLWVVGVCLLLLHCLERLDGNGDRRNGRCWTILAMGEHMNPGRTTREMSRDWPKSYQAASVPGH
jgi:hypothetical protein